MMFRLLFEFEHLLIALVVQAAMGWLTGNWWAGAALMSGVLMGREHAQAEYKWIERYGQGRRANLPWWGWADPRVWDVHSWFWNLSLPIAAVLLMAGVM
ncbi:hypothetical protein UFOVP171_12 [uncultured Caudovirales phage]|uniref:Uncharacterized protein n=1 Tax=uncultured Caudovirales phage TaxID=2100421 RepID=A0A6J7WEW7_9CAUD|nr:hypothetical protein UFOVP171_12 [uncultured Caudovirales phage]